MEGLFKIEFKKIPYLIYFGFLSQALYFANTPYACPCYPTLKGRILHFLINPIYSIFHVANWPVYQKIPYEGTARIILFIIEFAYIFFLSSITMFLMERVYNFLVLKRGINRAKLIYLFFLIIISILLFGWNMHFEQIKIR
jgi:hypothetical protein